MPINTKSSSTTINDRFQEAHDDMLGTIGTGVAGANQWLVQNVRDTLYPLQYLRNNSSDFFCVHIQSPHWRKQSVNIDSIHIHYILDGGYNANQTLVFNVSYAWVIPGTIFPAIAGWTVTNGISRTLSTGNLGDFYTGILNLVTDIPFPSPEGYGTGLVIKIERGNGTYAGNLGIWWADVHAVKDRLGSFNEFND